ncbi:MAG: hypothetical protein ACPGXL_06700, partial [Chitinophagales bacterium]
DPSLEGNVFTKKIVNGDDFFTVFAICFPAFTGMTAGVGLSGDLKDPSRSIPLGTLAATLSGMVIYIIIAYKLASSASSTALATDQMVMGTIAWWYPIIPIGLAAATISSALGSIMVAPRTLQAIGADNVLPVNAFNSYTQKGKGGNNEPFNATIVTIIIAFGIIMINNVNFVAEIISMFFMVTYGSLCLISFLQHFASDPSYRPVFKSRWYISLLGFLMCIWLMFKMNPPYAFLSIIIMVLLYWVISAYGENRRGIAAIFQGVAFQLSRQMQVFLQNAEKGQDNWRPSVVCVSAHSFERFHAFNLLRWLSDRYGFGTYIHFVEDYYSSKANLESEKAMKRLLSHAADDSNVYLDTIISPSYTSAIAQVIQLRGISGKDNNMIMFEFAKRNPEDTAAIIDNYQLVKAGNFDVAILASSQRGFGRHRQIHVWISEKDYHSANLMILLAYIISGHSDWKKAEITIFAVYPEAVIEEKRVYLKSLIAAGRLPISGNNIITLPKQANKNIKTVISEHSAEACLTIMGFRGEALKKEGIDKFQGYEELGSILFVNSDEKVDIV